MKIMGLQKLTLLDYPGKTAAIVFVGGCNFDCTFCHNADLIPFPVSDAVSQEEIFAFLDKRKNVLEGVCITGGEPLLSSGLESFIKRIKEFGYAVKLDTNGTNPNKLDRLIKARLIDYVAMDIKNSTQKYTLTAGVEKLDLNLIEKSVQLIKSAAIEYGIDYEFRTTLISEYHTFDDLLKVGQWLKGAKKYVLQTFKDSTAVRRKDLSAFSKEETASAAEMLKQYISCVDIRE